MLTTPTHRILCLTSLITSLVEQIVKEPTHVHHNHSLSIIDLIFLTNSQLVNLCSIVPPLSNSDHNGILIQMRWRQSGSSSCPNNSKGRKIWLYDHADWDRAIELLDSCDWDVLLGQDANESWTTGVNSFCQLWKNVYQEGLFLSVGTCLGSQKL